MRLQTQFEAMTPPLKRVGNGASQARRDGRECRRRIARLEQTCIIMQYVGREGSEATGWRAHNQIGRGGGGGGGAGGIGLKCCASRVGGKGAWLDFGPSMPQLAL